MSKDLDVKPGGCSGPAYVDSVPGCQEAFLRARHGHTRLPWPVTGFLALWSGLGHLSEEEKWEGPRFPKSRARGNLARGSLQEPHPGEKEQFRAFLHCLGPTLLAGKAAVIKVEPYFLGVDSFELLWTPGCMGKGIGSSF